MLSVKLIVLGTLKEKYWRDAVAEYEKRLGAFCRLQILELKEERMGDDPSEGEIRQALDREADRILEQISPRAYPIALCVEGKQIDSEELAGKLSEIAEVSSEVCLIIGSSHGLSDRVKRACRMRLSVSKLTFPHQLMRVILLEALYRGFHIQKGTKYHK